MNLLNANFKCIAVDKGNNLWHLDRYKYKKKFAIAFKRENVVGCEKVKWITCQDQGPDFLLNKKKIIGAW